MSSKDDGKKNVVILGITSFLNDFSSEMILPILPFFLTSLGASPVLIGVVGGLRDSLTSIFKVAFGYLSDKYAKRKPFLYGGYAFSALFKLFLAISSNSMAAVLSASFERIGKGMRDAPRDAMISQFMPTRTGAAFGLHRMLDTGGAILGSVAVALILMFLYLTLDQIILIAATISFLSIIPLYFVKEPAFNPMRHSKFRIALTSLPKNVLVFTGIASLFALANFSYMFFIMRAVDGGIIIPILLYVVFNIMYAAFSYPLGKYSDKIGKRKILIGGYILFSIVCIGFYQFESLQSLIILFMLYGVANAAIIGIQRAYVSDISPSDMRATAIGAFHTCTGLAALPSSIIAGYLWSAFSPAYAFLFGGLVAFASAVALWVWRFNNSSSS